MYIESKTCNICEGNPDDVDENGICATSLTQKTCVNVFPCGALGDSCLGLYMTVEKELNDLPTGPGGGAPCDELGWSNTQEECEIDEDTGDTIYPCSGGQRICWNNATDWCYTMHYIALSEGIPEDDLVLVRDDDTSTAAPTNALSVTSRAQEWLYTSAETCEQTYIDKIYKHRQKMGNGVQNFCHVGHEGPLCALCSDVMVDGVAQPMEKGDDGLCHYCKGACPSILFSSFISSLDALSLHVGLLSCIHACPVLCCAVLCCAVLCCPVLCCPVLCCPVLCCAVLCCAVCQRPRVVPPNP